MKRSTRRTMVTALAALALASWPAGAEQEYLGNVGLCWSSANFDDFTDELSHVVLRCFGDTSYNQSVLVGVNTSGPYLLFFDIGRQWHVPDDRAAVDLIYRFDDQPAVSMRGVWNANHEKVSVNVDIKDAQAFLETMLTADRVIYRIGGDQTRILVVPLTGDRTPLYEAAFEYVTELLDGMKEDDA